MAIKQHLKNNAPKYAGGAVGVAMLTAAFTAPFEGFSSVAKHERIDPPGVITYGYGRTNYDDPNLKIGDTITKEKAREYLADDLAYKYLPPLRKCIPGFDSMPRPRQVAFLDASYNLGPGTVCKSSMARKINAGDVRGACEAFTKYNLVNGHVCDDAHCGLGRRRRAERDMCLREE